jgi:apolipoprotein N-acyltransferase
VSVAGTATTVARGDTDGLQRLADRTRRLTGARQLALSLVLGITAVAALPPVHAVPALIPAFTGFVWQLEGTRTRRRAFTVGWLFGLGFFAAGLYWVGIAFLVQAEIYGWMMPFAVAGLAGGLAIFTGLAALGVHMLPCRGTATRVLALTVAWMVASWLRGHVLTGFPWNLMATVWDPWPVMLQSAAVWGAWGLSTVTVFGAAAFAVLGACGSVSRRAGLPMTAVAVLAGVAGYGMTRLNAAPAAGAEHVDGVRLRIVQPSIPQAQKWDRDKRLAHLKTYLGLTRRPGLDEVSHVIWPETAVPLFLSKTQGLRDALGSVAPSNGALLTGLPRLVRADGTRRMYNSLYVIDGEGRTAARYDKFHLVPFGEYVPLEHWIPFPKLTAGRTGFTAGPGPRTLGIPGGPSVSPLICYEAIFPGNVTARGPRPGWLLNLTNDAWFGVSSGPYQHLASARLRAIEEGLPLVRAANTGISVVVDPHGRTWARLGLHERDVMDANLPHALPTTIYAQLGDIGFAGLIFLIISGLLPMLRR